MCLHAFDWAMLRTQSNLRLSYDESDDLVNKSNKPVAQQETETVSDESGINIHIPSKRFPLYLFTAITVLKLDRATCA